MRNIQEIIYLRIKDLSKEEIDKLADYDLIFCDNCGKIELSDKLRKIDGEYYDCDNFCVALWLSGMVFLCDNCYLERELKITKCNKCNKYFVKWDISTQPIICPHCDNKMNVYGCDKVKLVNFVNNPKGVLTPNNPAN